MHASALRPLLLARAHAVYSPVQLVGFADVVLDIKHTAGDGPHGRRRQALAINFPTCVTFSFAVDLTLAISFPTFTSFFFILASFSFTVAFFVVPYALLCQL